MASTNLLNFKERLAKPKLLIISHRRIFSKTGFSLGERSRSGYQTPVMTRASIEFSVKIFVFALFCTFLWTIWRVACMLGLL